MSVVSHRNTYHGWIQAFKIFVKYEGMNHTGICAGHDQIWAGGNVRKYSLSDIRILRKLGWYIDRDIERFYRYV